METYAEGQLFLGKSQIISIPKRLPEKLMEAQINWIPYSQKSAFLYPRFIKQQVWKGLMEFPEYNVTSGCLKIMPYLMLCKLINLRFFWGELSL